MQSKKRYIQRTMMEAYVTDAQEASAHYVIQQRIRRQLEMYSDVKELIQIKQNIHQLSNPKALPGSAEHFQDNLAKSLEQIPGLFRTKEKGMAIIEHQADQGQISPEALDLIRQNVEDAVKTRIGHLTSIEPDEFDDL